MRHVFFVMTLAFCAAGTVFAAPPVILFTDLSSGPKYGGKDGNGAFVTIIGRNFGTRRENGTVTVGGGLAADYPVWTDKKIVFQLGPRSRPGDIIVTTGEGNSNGMRFMVRPGNIYFVDDTSPGDPGGGTFTDPWRSPRSFFTAMRPGDICYFRAGTYAGRYGSGSRSYNVSFYRAGAPSGSPDHEIAWVGYPGEKALFKADDDTVKNGAFEFTDNVQYHVVSSLSLYGRGDGRGQVRIFSDNNKVACCDIEGIKTRSYGMIEVTATAGTRIWGNRLHGARSGDKLDHVLYCQSGADDVDFGWNELSDNDIGVGPAISIHQDGGSTGAVFERIRIHDNVIDCRGSSGGLRAIGVVESAPGGSVFIYNNVIIEGGGTDRSNHCIYIYSCSVSLYNNTFARTRGNGGAAVFLADNGPNYHPEIVEIKNNIFDNQPGCGYIRNTSSLGRTLIEANCYRGGTGPVPAADRKRVAKDPDFISGSTDDFRLSSGSPCIGAGVDASLIAPRDIDGTPRPKERCDLGAYEYPEKRPETLPDTR